MTSPPLACTVRDCGLLLERQGRTWQCARRHSYDIARAGYINLLQPQDRRSLAAGDRREAIGARARLLSRGVGTAIVREFINRAARLVTAGAVVADLGSGSGEGLAALAERNAIVGVGIDLSTEATAHAARRFPNLTWVVANVDRHVPLLDRSVDLVLSLHGRRHPADCARVLTRDGHLVVAVPAADDLIELRTVMFGRRLARERSGGVAAEHDAMFTVADRFTLTEHHRLERDQLRDLLRGTYRGERHATADRIESIDTLEVTLASDVLLFTRKTK